MALLLVLFLLGVVMCAPIGPRKTDRIAVIGAGPSGVAISYFLREKGYDDIVIFEKTDRVGGLVQDVLYKGTPQAMTAYASLRRYWTVEDILNEYGFEICPYPTSTTFYYNPDTQTEVTIGMYTASYVAAKYGIVYGTPQELSAALGAAIAKYIGLWSQLFGLQLDPTTGKSEYLFPSTRPPPAALADLSMNSIDWIVKNDLQILEPTLRRLSDVNGYGPLEKVSAFGIMTWVHPSTFKGEPAWLPCAGYLALLETLALPFRIEFNADITSVKRTDTEVTINYNGGSETFNWIVFTNKFNGDSADFIDLRADEQQYFANLHTSHLKTYLISTDAGVFLHPEKTVVLNLDALTPTWMPDVSSWTYGCVNSLALRNPGDTSLTDVRICAQNFYDEKTSTQAEQEAELQTFLARMGANGQPVATSDYEIVYTVETDIYWQKHPNNELGRLWDIWNIQGFLNFSIGEINVLGKYRSFYIGSATTGIETVADMFDYSKQLVDKFVEREADPEPSPEPSSGESLKILRVLSLLLVFACSLL